MIDRDHPQVQARLCVHEALQRAVTEIDPAPDGEHAVLHSWVAVAVLNFADGAMQMYRVSSDALGEGELPPWTVQGLLGYAVNDWEPMGVEDDDDDA